MRLWALSVLPNTQFTMSKPTITVRHGGKLVLTRRQLLAVPLPWPLVQPLLPDQ